MLAPGKPEAPVMFIDARDLASWILRMAEAKQAGTFNATGPDYVLSMGEHLDACKRVTKTDATFTWVDEAFLLEHKVAPYAELPLWVPEAAIGFNAFDCRKAWAAGLTFRPLEETIRDTWHWDMPRTEADRNKNARAMIPPPITREREFELLKSWKEVVKAS